MIAFLSGTLAAKTAASALVDVNGVGYEALMSQSALSKLPAAGEPVTVLTYLQSTDSGLALYGFLAEEERETFVQLIAVNGVGPKMALAALSTFSPQALREAILAEDASLIAKVPGVGKKTASRIIVDLKGSIERLGGAFAGQPAPQAGAASEAASLAAASEALASMGFSPAEVELSLKDGPEGADEVALIQYALKRLGQR